jgi:hypothetical protein
LAKISPNSTNRLYSSNYTTAEDAARTQDSIREQLKKLKIVQTKDFFVQTIKKAEILSFEEFVGRYVDAFVML